MKQTLFLAAIAAAAWICGYENHAVAQQTGEETAQDAAQDSQTTQINTDAGNDASGQPADSQPTQPADAQPEDRPSPAATSQPQPADATSQNVPTPANQTQRQPNASQDQRSNRQPVDQAQRTDRGQYDRSIDRPDSSERSRDQFDDRSRGRDDRDSQWRGDRSRDGDRWRDRDVNVGIHFGVGSGRGLTIDTIDRGSVFFDSGLSRGDVIISIDGRVIRSEDEFVRFVRLNPGRRVPVVVLRNGREETVYITYDDAPDQAFSYREAPAAGSQAFLGVTFDGRIPDAAVVRSIAPQSPAEQAGLRPGDAIHALNGEGVSSYGDAIGVIRSMRAGEKLSIDFSRRVDHQTEAVLDDSPGDVVRTATNPADVRVERDIRVERGVAPALRDRDVDIRLDADRDDGDYDRDWDEDRDEDRDERRPLLPFRRN